MLFRELRKNWLLLTPISTMLLSVDAMPADVGVAAIDIEPEIGVPLAGYGAKERRLPGFLDWGNKYDDATFFRPSTGRHSPIRSKAMVIRGDGAQVVFLSLDLVGVDKRLVSDLAAARWRR